MPLRLTRLEFERLLRRRRVQKSGVFTKRERPEKMNAGRRWEVELAAQLDEAGFFGRYVREYRFRSDRRFRFDFAFVPEQFAIEVDGAVHRIKSRFHGDREKGQLALTGGWTILHVGPDQVRNGEALSLAKQLLSVAADR